ncbi:hypothetical protein B0G80_4422 [Paraburkholderia sp. BL6669N2]|uniref:hypothetical protein n=1 Tax=Paraburkholderia sp. BL6669N2 TaxID=1938807 RepID=UPI000E253219|nr:hypothetical protein [Paraburkholderia sp. BL6669N2]REG61569.1 hypothetical protein B0G80_4422 [Paraburkholderia sp. BL6669N2]
MPSLLRTQQLARVLLAQGVSGEIVCSGDGLTVVVDDERQREIATAVVAKYFPGQGHVVHRSI